ncbi:MAG TPA: T9SS type A sorting domain-containing protein, partial [Cytophagales bacterium]|nr:T9SS type A sorting domain-containing protein [Cytophagales bacterium]
GCHKGGSYVYQSTDIDPGYYRIKRIEKNGISHLSYTVRLVKGAENKYAIFPNPTTGSFMITGPPEVNYKIEIFNVLGQSLLRIEAPEAERNHMQVDLGSLARSRQVLIVKIHTPEEGQVHTERLIIQP